MYSEERLGGHPCPGVCAVSPQPRSSLWATGEGLPAPTARSPDRGLSHQQAVLQDLVCSSVLISVDPNDI